MTTTYLSGQCREVTRLREVVFHLLILDGKVKDVLDTQGRILGGVDVFNIGGFHGVLLFGHDRFHKIYVHGLVWWKIKSAIDGQQATRLGSRCHVMDLLIDLLLASILGSQALSCDLAKIVQLVLLLHDENYDKAI